MGLSQRGRTRRVTAKAGGFGARTGRFIDRIEALDGELNAVPVRDFARAREAARQADAALARGERLPLLGVPVTIKESYNVAGLSTTWGIPAAKDFIPPEDALAVSRLKAAGAIVLGKTNVPLGLGDGQSYNDIYGTTNNPWDRTRSPGGSSGGSSAALAAGFGPLSLGSDIGGSLRVPAHFCGVCAHKPTFDLVPFRGHTPPGVPAWAGTNLAVLGPMARSVDDLVPALDIIAGPDEAADGRAYRLNLPPARGEKLSDFRVLVIAEHPLLPTSAAVGASLDRLSKHLAAGRRRRQTRGAAPSRSRGFRTALCQAPERLPVGGDAGRPISVRSAAEKIPAADQSLVAELMRGALLSAREWFRADFARQGAATAMARPVPELRRRRLPAGRDARLSPRPLGASRRPQDRRRRQGIPLSPPTGLGRSRDDLRPAGDCRSRRCRGRSAGWRADHRPRIRRPDAARLRPVRRARIRRVRRPAGLRLGPELSRETRSAAVGRRADAGPGDRNAERYEDLQRAADFCTNGNVCKQVVLARSPGRITGICAKGTAGVDVKRRIGACSVQGVGA